MSYGVTFVPPLKITLQPGAFTVPPKEKVQELLDSLGDQGLTEPFMGHFVLVTNLWRVISTGGRKFTVAE
jgi:hypothetical protein